MFFEERDMTIRERTELENALAENLDFAFVRGIGGSPEETQDVLDTIATDVCRSVGPRALVEHMRVVYGETAGVYAKNTEHLFVPDALLSFMNANFPTTEEPSILDLGCGFGRDAVFMSSRDVLLRKQFLGRTKDGKTAFERFGVPAQVFSVIGVDSSPLMAAEADQFALKHGLWSDKHVPAPDLLFLGGIDMHDIDSCGWFRVFDGIWSSAALFMHTPKECVGVALTAIHRALRQGGIFGVSYMNNASKLSYDNLRYSRTGAIKYFSRPEPELIAMMAHFTGLELVKTEYSDLEMAGKVQEHFFITQFFQKK
jgi:SAM-dependent methyltransferase